MQAQGLLVVISEPTQLAIKLTILLQLEKMSGSEDNDNEEGKNLRRDTHCSQ